MIELTSRCEMCGVEFVYTARARQYARRFCAACACKRKNEYKLRHSAKSETGRLAADNKRIELDRITRDVERRRLNREAVPDTAPRHVRYDRDGTRVEIRGSVGGIQMRRVR